VQRGKKFHLSFMELLQRNNQSGKDHDTEASLLLRVKGDPFQFYRDLRVLTDKGV